MIEKFDKQTGYCRSLGHFVDFRYCRTTVGEQPCRKILDCWHERFDIRSYAELYFPKEWQESIGAPPQPKIATLVDLIRQAREREQESVESS